MDYYHYLCKECDNLYHCFDTETAENLERDKAEDMFVAPWSCGCFTPMRKQ